MKKVYFKSIDSYLKTEEISRSAAEILNELVKAENINNISINARLAEE